MNAVKVPTLPPLPDGVTPHVAALTGRLFEAIRQSLTDGDWDGLRPSHFRLLANVAPTGTTITELSTALFMTKQAVGQFVTQLEDSGHLVVRTDEGDRRRRLVQRTSRGEAIVEAVDAHVAALEQSWAAQVGEDRYRDFLAVLAEISQSRGR
jgi:DNA-binding MarR family transcriptional regulator